MLYNNLGVSRDENFVSISTKRLNQNSLLMSVLAVKQKKELFHLTTLSTHFIYDYMASGQTKQEGELVYGGELFTFPYSLRFVQLVHCLFVL